MKEDINALDEIHKGASMGEDAITVKVCPSHKSS